MHLSSSSSSLIACISNSSIMAQHNNSFGERKKTTTTSRSDETWYFSKKEKQASLDSAYDTAHTRTSSAGWSEDWPGLAQCNAQKKKKKKNECKHFVLSFLSLCYLTQCHRTIAHWPRFFFSSFFTFSALLVAET